MIDSKKVAKHTLKLKRILVPVDFSISSNKALDYAVAFAKQFQAEISLFHVVATPQAAQFPLGDGITCNPASDTDALKREAEAQWRKAVGSGLKVTTTLGVGVAHHEIVRAANETKTNLIIIGHQGRSGLAHLLLGGTAERVVRHAPCPVLVVRKHEHEFLKNQKISKRRQVTSVSLRGLHSLARLG